MSKKTIYLILRLLIATLLLVVGLSLIFQDKLMNMAIDTMTATSIENAAGSTYQESIENVKKQDNSITFNFEDVTDVTAQEIAKIKFQMKDKLPQSIGSISIPSLQMELPILYGVSNLNLAIGAGTMKDSIQMGKGNYSLAGHNTRNERTLFSPLVNATKGMDVYLTDFEDVYHYKINTIYTVEPTQVDVIEQHGEQIELTLVTCNYLGEKRQITHAKFIRVLSANEFEKTNKDVFRKD